ncbi:MAG: hypothetical protein WC455_13425 [Dehalococcoidia bacterium]|jgi:hypothetical protein
MKLRDGVEELRDELRNLMDSPNALPSEKYCYGRAHTRLNRLLSTADSEQRVGEGMGTRDAIIRVLIASGLQNRHVDIDGLASDLMTALARPDKRSIVEAFASLRDVVGHDLDGVDPTRPAEQREVVYVEETADFAWKEVVAAFRTIWGDDVAYNDSPVELIYRLRDERDETKRECEKISNLFEGEHRMVEQLLRGAEAADLHERHDELRTRLTSVVTERDDLRRKLEVEQRENERLAAHYQSCSADYASLRTENDDLRRKAEDWEKWFKVLETERDDLRRKLEEAKAGKK